MQIIELTEAEFDKLMNRLDKVEMEKDGYIPSEEDVFDYIEKHPEKYYLYLLWYSEHKPKPQSEEEKKELKKDNKNHKQYNKNHLKTGGKKIEIFILSRETVSNEGC